MADVRSIDNRVVFGVLAVIVVASIFGNRNGRLWYGPGAEPEIMSFDDEDAEMNSAMEEARNTVDVFLDALSNKTSSRSHLSVKLGIRDDNGAEHFWLNNVRYKDGEFTGTVANTPNTVRSVRFGQSVSVPQDQISDWMFIEKGRLAGGFTMRVMRSRLSPEERADFDANIGFNIE